MPACFMLLWAITASNDVGALVERLDAPTLAQRELAESSLVEMGPAVLDELPAVGQAGSPEAEQRLARVRLRLQQAQAAGSIEPARVTIAHTTAPWPQIVAEIARQTGNPVVLAAGAAANGRQEQVAGQQVTVEFSREPFWPALDQVMAAAGQTAYLFAEQKAVAVMPRASGPASLPAPLAYAGPFRIEATRVETVRDLRSGRSTAAVMLEIAWEPRLSPIAVQVPVKTIKAIGPDGSPLADDAMSAMNAGSAVFEVPISPQSMAAAVRVPLVPAGRSHNSAGAAGLAMKLDVLMPAAAEDFRFQRFAAVDARRPMEVRHGRATVSLDGWRAAGDGLWEVRLRVRFDEPRGALASHRTWIFQNPVWLELPDGGPIPYISYEATGQSDHEVSISYRFRTASISAATLVYRTPTAIFAASLPFVLERLALR